MAKVFEPKLYIKYIQDSKSDIISSITFDEKTGKGKITYNPKCVNVDPEAPDFKGTTTNLNDEEMVRAVLLLKLEKEYGYKFENKYIDIEKVYEAPGRPKKGAKGSRSDIVIRNEDGSPFLYFELKTPQKYISERYLIKGQLFQSSKLEKIKRTDYLLWTTVVFNDSGEPAINTLVISTSQYGEYDKWQDAGEPAGNAIPKGYGTVIQKSYARVPKETETSIPLDETSDELFFKQLTEELHNVIWGGGGTNNNDVFAVITKLFLCKMNDLPKVLFNYRGNKSQKSLRYGFETTLKAIFSRSTLRLDAKYRWLWDVLEGKISLVARGAAWNDIGNYVKIVELNKIKKGDLAYDRKLIDLDSVYPLCGGVNYDEVPEVSMIGSDKVEFSGADLVVSKLEPYLGKCIINPEEEAIGTTEWVGLKCKKSSPRVVGYLLSLPQMREAMRMLQSGKRHARMDAKELLQLKINIDLAKILEQDIQKYEEEINSLKNTVMEKRKKIDDLYSI